MPTSSPPVQLLCLCAAWCHLCSSFAPVFAKVAERLRDDWPDLASRWIDIEDEAERVGDLDVETFPTIVLLRGARVLFHGPLVPQPEVLERVVRAALVSEGETANSVDPAVPAFARRVMASGP